MTQYNEYLDIATLLLPDGSFMGDEFGEVDSRFSYCAVASLCLLDALDAVDRTLIMGFLMRCQNLDGGFGLAPFDESHAGQAFCCIAALSLLSPTILEAKNFDKAAAWLAARQLPSGGLNGRPEKLEDASHLIPSLYCSQLDVVGVLFLVGAFCIGHPSAPIMDRQRCTSVLYLRLAGIFLYLDILSR